MNGPVHPPCWKPPSVSSPACPGPWITPSSEVYSITVILLIAYLLRSTGSPGRSAAPRAGSARSGHLLRRHPAGPLTGLWLAQYRHHTVRDTIGCAMIFLTSRPGGTV